MTVETVVEKKIKWLHFPRVPSVGSSVRASAASPAKELSRMIKSGLAVVVACLAVWSSAMVPAIANDAAGTYKLDRAHGSLVWKVSHLGLSFYTARFDTFDATLKIDPEKPAEAKLTVTVDAKSVNTGFPFPQSEDFDKKIAEDPKFLNANEHPTITFVSTGVEVTGDKTAKVTGDLTLLGVTKPVVMDVALNGQIVHPFKKKPALGFSGSAKIKRSEFGLTHLVGPVGDDVELLMEVEFIKE
ncbi:MAG: YceI family protein [Pseudomonadota bacterium]